MIVRQMRPDEMAAVLDINRVAFGGEDEATLVADLVADASFIPELSLVAEERGRLIGHVLFTRAVIEGDSHSTPVVCLAPLAVVSDSQRTGVGTVLVEAGLERARSMGDTLAVVLGHVDYYPRFGFEPAIPRGVLAPYPVEPSEAWMVVELVPGALAGVAGVVRVGAPLDDEACWRE